MMLASTSGGLPCTVSKMTLPDNKPSSAAAVHLPAGLNTLGPSPIGVPDSAATGGLSSPCSLQAVAASSHKAKSSRAAVAAGCQQVSRVACSQPLCKALQGTRQDQQ